MKTEDLMIGDWYYWEAEGKMYHYQATAEDFVKGEIPNFQPVPLTSEILEKNGFGFIDISNDKYFSVWTGWWILDGLELGCCDNLKFPVFFNISDTNVKVNYVHELQHALKLCKIDKEIVL